MLVDGRERLAKPFSRRVVDPLNRLPGRDDGIDQILPLGRQERVACLELVELVDRHHVHRSKAVDLNPQPRGHLIGAQGRADVAGRGGVARRSDRAGHLRLRDAGRIVGHALVRLELFGIITNQPGVLTDLSIPLELLHFSRHLVQGQLQRVQAAGREVRQIGFRRRPGDVELTDDGTLFFEDTSRRARLPLLRIDPRSELRQVVIR